jgi:hypothetical protein
LHSPRNVLGFRVKAPFQRSAQSPLSAGASVGVIQPRSERR